VSFASVFLQAQPPVPAGGGLVEMLFPFLIIVVLFYFLILRPQQRRQKDHEATLKAAEKGDRVVTSGGIHGKIVGVADDVLTLEVAHVKGGEAVRLKVSRSRLDSVTKADDAKGKDS